MKMRENPYAEVNWNKFLICNLDDWIILLTVGSC